MTLKDKPIKHYVLPPVLFPHTQLEYPSFGELYMSQWGKCTAAVCLDIIIGKDIFIMSTQIHTFEWNYCQYALSVDGWGIFY